MQIKVTTMFRYMYIYCDRNNVSTTLITHDLF